MDLTTILNQIDAQISVLQQARAILTDAPNSRKAGRPAKVGPLIVERVRKPLSAEGRARIAAAQKRRWAKAKKTASANKAHAASH